MSIVFSLEFELFARTIVAGIAIASAAGALGCFVVWLRLAYFSDATAHASLLGVIAALGLSLPSYIGGLAAALVTAAGVSFSDRLRLHSDTMLGVIAHSSLALGIIAIPFVTTTKIDLMSLLIGDILAINNTDLAIVIASCAVILLVIGFRWSRLLTSLVSSPIAYSHGINRRREHIVIAACLGVMVAVSIKAVGVLLIASLLIIPAAGARKLASSPESMIVIAMILGIVSVIIGVPLSFMANTTTTATIISSSSFLFLLCLIYSGIKGARVAK